MFTSKENKFSLLLQSTLLTVCRLDAVAILTKLHLQELHGPVKQAVDHLEARVLVVVNGAQTPAVPRAHIWFVGTGDDSLVTIKTGLNSTTFITFEINILQVQIFTSKHLKSNRKNICFLK